MRRANPFRWAVVFVALAGAVCARADVVRIVIDGTINPVTAEYIERGLARSADQHAQALLIEIRTPGGLVDSTRDIIAKMLASPVPVIVYVYPTGSRSASAGFYILEAADIAAMAPGTNTGAAHPVLMGTTMDPVMKEKVENDSAAFMRSFAAKRGRNVEVAESAVRQSKSFTDQEALQQHLIDYVAKDVSDLLKQIDGRTVTRFDGRTTVIHTTGLQVVDYGMSLKEQILAFLMDPNIAFLILIIGAAAIYAEFNHPGAVIPGVVGLIFVVLAVFALNLLPLRFAGVALIVTAFILFALEAKFATHGALGVGGIAVLILGALLLVDGPIPQMRIRPITAVAVSVPFGLLTIFLVNIAVRARRGKVVTGERGLIGEIGIAKTQLRPDGKVFIHGEIWNAYCPSGAQPGQSVRVSAVHDLVLTVEPSTVGAPAGSTLN
ncbi:MAG TPA: nodulation protein NfeD [Terriglobales bacterium]|jgi:membrane-bound serine protease (ClpP class)|nr:nodulation protein NfeD [Terriglobales bacterium]HVI80396.1 nodulation protein NfeD [Candidatus Acidoferrum sp.]